MPGCVVSFSGGVVPPIELLCALLHCLQLDAFENSVLHLAIPRGDTTTLRTLLHAKASPMQTNRENKTPMHIACATERLDAVSLLLVVRRNFCICVVQAYIMPRCLLSLLLAKAKGQLLHPRDRYGKLPLDYATVWNASAACNCDILSISRHCAFDHIFRLLKELNRPLRPQSVELCREPKIWLVRVLFPAWYAYSKVAECEFCLLP